MSILDEIIDLAVDQVKGATGLIKPKRCQNCLKETDDLEWQTQSSIAGSRGGRWLCEKCRRSILIIVD